MSSSLPPGDISDMYAAVDLSKKKEKNRDGAKDPAKSESCMLWWISEKLSKPAYIT